jgi:hypothetical protein
MNIEEYIKSVLVSENPVLSMAPARGDLCYLDAVYDPVANNVVIYMTEDGMQCEAAIRRALNNEFNIPDIDHAALLCVIKRTWMLTIFEDQDPIKELSK